MANFGEIFLNPELLGIMQVAHEHGVVLKASDGVNFNNVADEVLEGLVTYGFESMACSIDGASDETYRRYRAGGSLPRVLDNIRRLNEYKARHGSDLPRLRWQFVVFGHNEHEIRRARALAKGLDMEFHLKLNWAPEFSPVKDLEQVRAHLGAATRDEFRSRSGAHYDELNCQRLWLEPQINWDGRVLGCTRNFWVEFGGNVFSDGLQAAVNTERLGYARRMLLGEAPPREDVPCSTCDIYADRRAANRWVPRRLVKPSLAYRVARAAYRRVRA